MLTEDERRVLDLPRFRNRTRVNGASNNPLTAEDALLVKPFEPFEPFEGEWWPGVKLAR
jgi:hypothetical protein